MWNKDISNKIKLYKKALQEEERQRNRLINKDLDYAYLEQIVKRCEANRDLIIELRLADGTLMTIKTDRKPLRTRSSEIFEQYEIGG